MGERKFPTYTAMVEFSDEQGIIGNADGLVIPRNCSCVFVESVDAGSVWSQENCHGGKYRPFDIKRLLPGPGSLPMLAVFWLFIRLVYGRPVAAHTGCIPPRVSG
jgi:hypothetical protein